MFLNAVATIYDLVALSERLGSSLVYYAESPQSVSSVLLEQKAHEIALSISSM